VSSSECPEPQPWKGEKAAQSLLDEADARIRQAETFAWAVPSLAIAAESFLLAAALRVDASRDHQAVAAGTGIVILFAALHFLTKHAFIFRVYEAVAERAREELGLPFVSMGQLVGSASPGKKDEAEQARIEAIRGSFPPHVELTRRHWLEPHPRGWRWVRNGFARRLRAVWVWTVVILILMALDAVIFVRALILA
jgi:hypothetical protein